MTCYKRGGEPIELHEGDQFAGQRHGNCLLFTRRKLLVQRKVRHTSRRSYPRLVV